MNRSSNASQPPGCMAHWPWLVCACVCVRVCSLAPATSEGTVGPRSTSATARPSYMHLTGFQESNTTPTHQTHIRQGPRACTSLEMTCLHSSGQKKTRQPGLSSRPPRLVMKNLSSSARHRMHRVPMHAALRPALPYASQGMASPYRLSNRSAWVPNSSTTLLTKLALILAFATALVRSISSLSTLRMRAWSLAWLLAALNSPPPVPKS
mmetsp:Transcript_86084/g.243169  ORF Transcript_86084/g.243169 Transcript_86084/m.243169 type:complete len:209 (+) Transcript_86084:29-655(+)